MYIIGTPHIFFHGDVHTSRIDPGGTVGEFNTYLDHTWTGCITKLTLEDMFKYYEFH